jgi:hypothetical protein
VEVEAEELVEAGKVVHMAVSDHDIRDTEELAGGEPRQVGEVE